jgi:hypothetical protein
LSALRLEYSNCLVWAAAAARVRANADAVGGFVDGRTMGIDRA